MFGFQQVWPRTGTEKLLAEMFDCASAQFLAIEEALGETNRRIAMPSAAATDSDFEILDVVIELLLAGEYLAAGGAQDLEFRALVSGVNNEDNSEAVNKSQIAMAIAGGNEVRMGGFLRMVKFAFNYEAWEVFRRLSAKIITFIQVNFSIPLSLPNILQALQSSTYLF